MDSLPSFEKLQYAAGFFDGSGGISIQHLKPTESNPTRNVFQTYIRLRHKDRLTLSWFPSEFKIGKLYQYGKHWVWTLSGRKAISFLKAIYSFAKSKKAEIELILKFDQFCESVKYENSEETLTRKLKFKADLESLHKFKEESEEESF